MHTSTPGYTYDIFISYRQKDNRYDGWVTDFVANLKKELEVHSKEPISVYFDENPYDGIQEGHEVSDSLKEKLRCLIFIPIISQTYCDPTSYAWKNEFQLFKEFASADKVGIKVKLRNGNFVRRILPVCIHEIDDQDTILLEKEIGGPIRSIDFIFKATGVNRPLLSKEDHPHQNQCNTYYRDQINKVAIQVKEIILALKKVNEGEVDKKSNSSFRFSRLRKGEGNKKQSILWLSVLPIVILLALFLLYRNDFRVTSKTVGERTIAVLPFKVIGDDDESLYFAEGVQEAVRVNLCRFEELKVKSRTSVERYRNNLQTIQQIASELNVQYVLEGSAHKIGDNIRVIVRLIEARTDENVWSEQFDRKFTDIFAVENQISESIAASLKATLTPEITNRIHNRPTDNFEAYDLFLRSQQASRKYTQSHDAHDLSLSIRLLRKSLSIDPEFALGYGWLAGLKLIENAGQLSSNEEKDTILLLANKALALDSTIVEAQLALSELHFVNNDDVLALRHTYKALESELIDSLSIVSLLKRLGEIYSRVGDTEKALALFDALLKLSPVDQDVLYAKILALAATADVKQLTELRKTINQLNSNSPLIDFVDLHIALEKKSVQEIGRIYLQQKKRKSRSAIFDEYGLVFAHALKQMGNKADAQAEVDQFEEQFFDDPYFKAQLEIFRGRQAEGLALIHDVDVGWYNVNLCEINPVFLNIVKSPEFQSFIDRNKTRLNNVKERIHQLEVKGHLPVPSFYLQTKPLYQVSS